MEKSSRQELARVLSDMYILMEEVLKADLALHFLGDNGKIALYLERHERCKIGSGCIYSLSLA
jgi:hypothetical protein